MKRIFKHNETGIRGVLVCEYDYFIDIRVHGNIPYHTCCKKDCTEVFGIEASIPNETVLVNKLGYEFRVRYIQNDIVTYSLKDDNIYVTPFDKLIKDGWKVKEPKPKFELITEETFVFNKKCWMWDYTSNPFNLKLKGCDDENNNPFWNGDTFFKYASYTHPLTGEVAE